MLRAKLWEKREMEQSHVLSEQRSVIGRGMRAEKIRTYNFPQDRVTDHRINKSFHNIDAIMDGKLQKLTEALIESHV